MFAEERHAKIAELLAAKGRVSVAALAERFEITRETVRRDLAVLENDGVLRRVHGGAVTADRMSTSEQSLSSRQSQRHDEKARIARRALEMIPTTGSGSVVLDAGTTTELLADLLYEQSAANDGLLIITHAVPIAYKISNSPSLQLEFLGGRVRGLTRATVGPSTVEQMQALRPDIAFLGANGVHAGFGLSTPDVLEASVKTAIVRAARRVVALVDASKLDEEALVSFASLNEIDTLITDGTPSNELAAALADAEVEVVIV